MTTLTKAETVTQATPGTLATPITPITPTTPATQLTKEGKVRRAQSIKLSIKINQFKHFKLCYVDGNTAFFTTNSLEDQWGDDWNDAPYEHNAGEPYGPTIFHHMNGVRKLDPRAWQLDGTPNYQLLRVRFDPTSKLEVKRPCDTRSNSWSSPYSVEDINAKKVPWLTFSTWDTPSKRYEIVADFYAGISFVDFFRKMDEMGAEILIPHTGLQAYPQKEENPVFQIKV